MKVLVAYSGGKDSQASLIWAVEKYGVEKVEAVFCDTNWEHQDTYNHIQETTSQMGVKLVVLKSKKYLGMLDMAKKRNRFPSVKARFCTEELKTYPMIDYILEHQEHLIIIQGIRADESLSRSKMSKQCSYFKYYFEPYRLDKKNKPVFHTYRKSDVKEFRANYLDDVIRPVFDWTANQVLNYILDYNQKPNPLYYRGVGRVGCFPCIMCSKKELKQMIENDSDFIEKVRNAENETKHSFFNPKYIPKWACKNRKFPLIDDVVKYINEKNSHPEFDFNEPKEENRRCMSFYSICE